MKQTPEEFAAALDEACQHVNGGDDCARMAALIAARDAELTAELRAEVARLRESHSELGRIATKWGQAIIGSLQSGRLPELDLRDTDTVARLITAARALAEAENARLLEQCVPPQVAHDAVGVCRDLAAKLKGDAWPSADVWWYRIQLRAEAIDRAAAKAPAPEGGPGKEATREA